MQNRREFLKRAGLLAVAGASALTLASQKGHALFGFGNKDDKGAKGAATNNKSEFPYQLTDKEWKEKLSPEAYKVLRKAGTERSGSSPLNNEKREGVFHCKGCDHPLYSSAAKFESGTGWPSFYEPFNEKSVGTSTDYHLFYPRTEVHCANCGGHQGHIFEDGPKPTGLRHCINGVAMVFKPA